MTHDRQSEKLNQFLAAVERRAFEMARMATRDTDEALDLVQDAMFKLVQRYASKEAGEWGPLFYRILQHRIKDWQRRTWVRNRWRHWFFKDEDNEVGDDPIQNIPEEGFKDFADQISDGDAVAALEGVLSDLPLRQRQAFLLRVWEGYTVAQTATAMSCSQGSVKTHYSRAVRALRLRLKEYAP